MTSWLTTGWRAVMTAVAVDGLARAGRQRRYCEMELIRDPVSGNYTQTTLTVRDRDLAWFTQQVEREMDATGQLGAGGLEAESSHAATITIRVVYDE
jgi:hypothetical protein